MGDAVAGYRLGIDIGTTQTAAAVERDGAARVVSLGLRVPEIPSVVAVLDDEVVVGGAAERQALSRPEAVAREFKRRTGDPTPLIVGGSPWSAESLTGRVLSHVLDEVKILEGEPPSRLAVTHPASWTDFKKDCLRQALLFAGHEDADLLPEPIAAANFYASQGKASDGERVAVFDLGGGTFDAAVLEADGSTFRILGEPKGLAQLGGIDLDQVVVAHVLDVLGLDLTELDDDAVHRRAIQRLRDDCRTAKENLSADTSAAVPVILPNIQTEVRITRSEFENKIREPLLSAVSVLGTAIESAGLETADVDTVLLVGGSSRIPLVSQLIGEQLALPVQTDSHPKHTVALGAALFASSSTKGELQEHTERPFSVPSEKIDFSTVNELEQVDSVTEDVVGVEEVGQVEPVPEDVVSVGEVESVSEDLNQTNGRSRRNYKIRTAVWVLGALASFSLILYLVLSPSPGPDVQASGATSTAMLDTSTAQAGEQLLDDYVAPTFLSTESAPRRAVATQQPTTTDPPSTSTPQATDTTAGEFSSSSEAEIVVGDAGGELSGVVPSQETADLLLNITRTLYDFDHQLTSNLAIGDGDFLILKLVIQTSIPGRKETIEQAFRTAEIPNLNVFEVVTVEYEGQTSAEAELDAQLLEWADQIDFEQGTAVLTPGSLAIMDRVAEQFVDNPGYGIGIGVFADSSEDVDLTQPRANALQDALRERNVQGQIQAFGYQERWGDEDPLILLFLLA